VIQAIIFDCFGVLTADIWHEFVLSLPDSQRAPADQINRAYDAGLITLDERLRHVRELTGHEPPDITAQLGVQSGKNTQLLNYIATLKTRYKIGMLSNIGTNWIRDEFLTVAEQALFDDMVFSFQVHLSKPDPQIFEIAAQRLGVDPDACVLIDDVLPYCTVAKELSMQAIVYNNFSQMRTELEKILASQSE
jgi:epoxide hydrolase-like predicted phosphatase